jgi:hypothetical protein
MKDAVRKDDNLHGSGHGLYEHWTLHDKGAVMRQHISTTYQSSEVGACCAGNPSSELEDLVASETRACTSVGKWCAMGVTLRKTPFVKQGSTEMPLVAFAKPCMLCACLIGPSPYLEQAYYTSQAWPALAQLTALKHNPSELLVDSEQGYLTLTRHHIHYGTLQLVLASACSSRDVAGMNCEEFRGLLDERGAAFKVTDEDVLTH